MDWTNEQQNVIDIRDRNILVSAAAGSGKTAVLIERIFNRIMNDNPRVSVDDFLVVTFTEAAAAEMKERLHKKLTEAMRDHPDDLELKKQETLVHNAQISTIHGFCLQVIRDHFHAIDLDPGFRVADDGEVKLMKRDVVADILEEAYEAGEQKFLDFIMAYGGDRDDKKVEEMILKVFDFSQSFPDPMGWLKTCADAYDIASEEAFLQGESAAFIIKESLRMIEASKACYNEIFAICDKPDGPKHYRPVMEEDLSLLVELDSALSWDEDGNLKPGAYENFAEAVGAFKKRRKRLPGKSKVYVDPDLREYAKNLRAEALKKVDQLVDDYFSFPLTDSITDIQRAHESVLILADLVVKFQEAFSARKKENTIIDFNDMEHLALQILVTKTEDGEYVPTAAALEYRQRFKEIMIDEYQDSNEVQEVILKAVSGMSQGNYNMFMVGDVKQSIYRFRQARPELFMWKYDHYDPYPEMNSATQKIVLSKNFRSRREVLDSANFLFERLMAEDLGGVSYDENARLNFGAADYTETEGNVTEIIFAKKESDDALEARLIATKIRELIKSGFLVKDKDEAMRPIRYSDIAILCRSLTGPMAYIEKELKKQNIPVYVQSRSGYFETREIQILLDYLKVLDNRKQDLPLAAVLMSCFVGLSEFEMAEIRLFDKGHAFCEAVELYAHEPERRVDFPLQKKLQAFYEQLDHYREIVPYTSIPKLLEKIISETGYEEYVSAMEGGMQRLSNVQMLLEMARNYEATCYKGLFHFMRYIESLKKQEVDYGEAASENFTADQVRIMTMHKSKGLEFPVVFAAGMGKQFNTADQSGSVLLHPTLGIGLKSVDLKNKTESENLIRAVMKGQVKKDTLGEELRVLYVAFTRAKEKLFITGCNGTIDKRPVPMENEDLKGPLPYANRLLVNGYSQWILNALSGADLSKHSISFVLLSEDEVAEYEKELASEEMTSAEEMEEFDASLTYDVSTKEQLQLQFGYTYPESPDKWLKVKYSVSEIKHRNMAHGEEPAELVDGERKNTDSDKPVPKFALAGDSIPGENAGASYGSAVHRFLELWDFTVDPTRENIENAKASFYADGKMTKEMCKVIFPRKLQMFFGTDAARRMKAAGEKGCLFKEQPFVIDVPAKKLLDETNKTDYAYSDTDRSVLVQGIIDVFFEEADGITLLDYKTDNVGNEDELIARYETQLRIYGEALRRSTGKPVKDIIIYSFRLNREIHI